MDLSKQTLYAQSEQREFGKQKRKYCVTFVATGLAVQSLMGALTRTLNSLNQHIKTKHYEETGGNGLRFIANNKQLIGRDQWPKIEGQIDLRSRLRPTLAKLNDPQSKVSDFKEGTPLVSKAAESNAQSSMRQTFI